MTWVFYPLCIPARLLEMTGIEMRKALEIQGFLVLVFIGVEGSRTPDLCSAIAALYQLSYYPDARKC